VTDPLILVTPTQQFLPQFYVHAPILYRGRFVRAGRSMGQTLAKPVFAAYEGLTGQAFLVAAGRGGADQ
jgi:hypothetical protein